MNSILKEKPLNDIRSYIYKVYLILLFYFHQIVVLSKHFTIFRLQNGGINLIALYPLDDSLRQIHASLVAKWEATTKTGFSSNTQYSPFSFCIMSTSRLPMCFKAVPILWSISRTSGKSTVTALSVSPARIANFCLTLTATLLPSRSFITSKPYSFPVSFSCIMIYSSPTEAVARIVLFTVATWIGQWHHSFCIRPRPTPVNRSSCLCDAPPDL